MSVTYSARTGPTLAVVAGGRWEGWVCRVRKCQIRAGMPPSLAANLILCRHPTNKVRRLVRLRRLQRTRRARRLRARRGARLVRDSSVAGIVAANAVIS